MSSKLILKSK